MLLYRITYCREKVSSTGMISFLKSNNTEVVRLVKVRVAVTAEYMLNNVDV